MKHRYSSKILHIALFSAIFFVIQYLFTVSIVDKLANTAIWITAVSLFSYTYSVYINRCCRAELRIPLIDLPQVLSSVSKYSLYLFEFTIFTLSTNLLISHLIPFPTTLLNIGLFIALTATWTIMIRYLSRFKRLLLELVLFIIATAMVANMDSYIASLGQQIEFVELIINALG